MGSSHVQELLMVKFLLREHGKWVIADNNCEDLAFCTHGKLKLSDHILYISFMLLFHKIKVS